MRHSGTRHCHYVDSLTTGSARNQVSYDAERRSAPRGRGISPALQRFLLVYRTSGLLVSLYETYKNLYIYNR